MIRQCRTAARGQARAAAFGMMLALLGACSHEASTATVADVTVQQVMATRVDPAADALWASVSTVITAAGTEERQPRSAAEWQAVRRSAETLVQGTAALMVPRLRVSGIGLAIEDASVPGIERPEDIQKAIDADPKRFTDAASRLRAAALEALKAIDARSAEKLVEAGGDMDEACEACHLTYWYPNSPRPK